MHCLVHSLLPAAPVSFGGCFKIHNSLTAAAYFRVLLHPLLLGGEAVWDTARRQEAVDVLRLAPGCGRRHRSGHKLQVVPRCCLWLGSLSRNNRKTSADAESLRLPRSQSPRAQADVGLGSNLHAEGREGRIGWCAKP